MTGNVLMETLKIVWLCIAAAIAYGILHDQVTARVCVEYFTVGHPPVFHTSSPTLLALGWGVIATWWVGLILGIPMALVSRLGRWPKLEARRLFRPIGVLLILMGCTSLLAGLAGYWAASAGKIGLEGPLQSRIPLEKQAAFLADLWAHSAAYDVGFLGGLAVCGWVWFKRWQISARRAEKEP